MQPRDIVGFTLVPLLLLIAAWGIEASSLWSTTASMTLAWFCSAIAISIWLLGAVCIVMQCSPSEIPGHIAYQVVVGVLLIFLIGMAVDWYSYKGYTDVAASTCEWLGFAIILITTFRLPHTTNATK